MIIVLPIGMVTVLTTNKTSFFRSSLKIGNLKTKITISALRYKLPNFEREKRRFEFFEFKGIFFKFLSSEFNGDFLMFSSKVRFVLRSLVDFLGLWDGTG